MQTTTHLMAPIPGIHNEKHVTINNLVTHYTIHSKLYVIPPMSDSQVTGSAMPNRDVFFTDMDDSKYLSIFMELVSYNKFSFTMTVVLLSIEHLKTKLRLLNKTMAELKYGLGSWTKKVNLLFSYFEYKFSTHCSKNYTKGIKDILGPLFTF